MHKSKLGNIVIDCQSIDLGQVAQFWSSALGYPLPETWVADSLEGYVQLVTPPGELAVAVQRVTHPSRAHLDVETDNIPHEVARLQSLGATIVRHHDQWTVMQAPSGQHFCVTSAEGVENLGLTANLWK